MLSGPAWAAELVKIFWVSPYPAFVQDGAYKLLAVNSALVSRSRVFQFQPLSCDDIRALLRRAIADRHLELQSDCVAG